MFLTARFRDFRHEPEERKRGLKIWRYVDLAKFVHMLATGTLYFPCATTELKDPYEGWLPRSHIKALMQINRGILDQMSMAETNCAKWRRESVPVGLREKGFEARCYFCF
jgi:hypothetical protein